jgi:hypothetical protein
MNVLRRTVALFVGGLALAVALPACGAGDPAQNASVSSLGIPALETVDSGELETTLTASIPGRKEQIAMRLIGSFLEAGGPGLPQVDFAAEAKGRIDGEAVDVDTALIATHDRAVLTYDGKTFETDPQMFEAMQASFGQAIGSGSAADVAACLEAAGRVEPSRIVRSAGRPIRAPLPDGTSVTVTNADLKGPGLSAALGRVISNPGCRAQLQAASLGAVLEGIESRLADGATVATGKLELDRKGLLRELSVQLSFGSGADKGQAEFVVRLNHINGLHELPPCHGDRPLVALFHQLGFNPLRPIEQGEDAGLIGLLDGIYRQPVKTRRA